MIKNTLISIALVALVGASSTAIYGQDKHYDEPKIKVFAGFSQLYTAPDSAPNTGPIITLKRDRVRLSGFNFAGEYRIAEVKGLYITAVADVSGHYGRVSNTAGVNLPFPAFPTVTLTNSNPARLHAFLAGPQLSKNIFSEAVTVFGRGLVGGARLNGAAQQEAVYALAFGAGGGIDLNFGNFFVRPVQLDYLRTQFEPLNQLKPLPQGYARQDSVRASFGAGLRF